MPKNYLLSVICLISLLSGLLTGCGETIDLYGESRMERGDPLPTKEETLEDIRENPHRNYKPPSPEEEETAATPNYKTDYGAADGIFLIVPPEDINPKNLEYAPDPQIMTIDFQKGFEWLMTVVMVDNQVIFQERLRSKPNGFADSVSFKYEEPPAKFTLIFPTLNLRETFTVDPEQGRFLAISLVDNQLSLDLKMKPFFYDSVTK